MAKLKVLLDTNVIVDCLGAREPFYELARRVLLCGRVGEFELWLASSQFTDLVYILSNGGAKSRLAPALSALRGLRSFVNVHPVGAAEIDAMLATGWKDPEDALLFEVAMRVRADAIITRNASDFETTVINVFDCEGFFAWLSESVGLDYSEIEF